MRQIPQGAADVNLLFSFKKKYSQKIQRPVTGSKAYFLYTFLRKCKETRFLVPPLLVGFLLMQGLYPIDQEVKQQLNQAPEDPAFLYQNSYIPEMGSADQIRSGQNNVPAQQEETAQLLEQEKKGSNIKLPSVTQILLIAIVIIVLVIYRIRMNKEANS